MITPTDTKPAMTQTQKPNDTRSATPGEKLNLSASQLIASGLAAISSTVAASYFGVAGTVIGAALGAVITVTGNAVYGHYLRRTRDRVLDLAVAQRFGTVRTVAPAGAGRSVTEPVVPRPGYRWRPKRLVLAAAGLFLVIMAATTGFEYASGRPLSATVTGKAGSGISVGGGHTSPAAPAHSAVPTHGATRPDRTAAPSSATPTVTVTVTPSPSDSASSSPAPTSSGSGGPGSTPPAPTPSPTSTPTG